MTEDPSGGVLSDDTLGQSDKLFRSIVEMARDAIVCVDESGAIILWNDAAEAVFHRSSQDMLGKDLSSLIPGRLWDRHRKAFERAMSRGPVSPHLRLYNTTALRADGTEFPMEISISVWREHDRTFATAVIRDTTEREQLLHELGDQKRRLDLAMSAGELGLWETDLRTGGNDWDERADRVAGYRPGELRRDMETWLSLIHPEDRDGVLEAMNRHIADPSLPYEVEYRCKTKSGEWKWIMGVGKAVEFDGEGRPTKMIGVARDIHERKQIELERERLVQQLREALEDVKRLSGLLPICSSCKKIRDDKGYWQQIEAYIGDHSEAEFSHSICPECAKKLYPELYGDSEKV